jgi:hypothetical protein
MTNASTFARRVSLRVTYRAALLCMGITSFGAAHAQANPYYIGAGIGYGYDSNVKRTSDDEQSDNFTSVHLLAGIDQPIGRQRFYADTTIRRTEYQDLSEESFTSVNAKVGLDWSALDRWTGNLRYINNRYPASETISDGESVRPTENVQEFYARAQYGLVSLLSLEGDYAHRTLDYNSAALASSEVKQDSVKFGVIYRPSGALRLGAGIRHTKGEYKNADPKIDFDRNEVEFTALWDVTGASSLDARLGIGKQEYSAAAAERDYDGATGHIRWNWRPTGKIRVVSLLSHDTGINSAFQTLGDGTVAIGDSTKATVARVEATWDATAKIRVGVNGSYARRTLNSGDREERDATRAIALVASYDITRNAQLSCQLGREERKTPHTQLTHRYEADFGSCSAQFVLR